MNGNPRGRPGGNTRGRLRGRPGGTSARPAARRLRITGCFLAVSLNGGEPCEVMAGQLREFLAQTPSFWFLHVKRPGSARCVGRGVFGTSHGRQLFRGEEGNGAVVRDGLRAPVLDTPTGTPRHPGQPRTGAMNPAKPQERFRLCEGRANTAAPATPAIVASGYLSGGRPRTIGVFCRTFPEMRRRCERGTGAAT